MTAHALIFDIDGTLLDSDGIDGELYAAAVRRVLGSCYIRDHWGDYEHVTDSGILRDILSDNGITSVGDPIGSIKHVFVELLREHIDTHGPFPQIQGARDFIGAVHGDPDRHCAYATGGWSASATLKLQSAGFPMEGVPLAACDNLIDRRAIMLDALQQLGRDYDTITYYGNGPWDRQAAADLGWHFTAVGSELNGITVYR